LLMDVTPPHMQNLSPGQNNASNEAEDGLNTPFQSLTKYVETTLRGYRVKFSQYYRDCCTVSVETGDAETGGDSKDGTLFKVAAFGRGFCRDDAAQKCLAALSGRKF